MLRRLKAMTLMQLEGWTPQVEFWEEPGTLMDGLQLIRRVTVSGRRRLAHAYSSECMYLQRAYGCTMHDTVHAGPSQGSSTWHTYAQSMHMVVDAGEHSHVHHCMQEPAPVPCQKGAATHALSATSASNRCESPITSPHLLSCPCIYCQLNSVQVTQYWQSASACMIPLQPAAEPTLLTCPLPLPPCRPLAPLPRWPCGHPCTSRHHSCTC